MAATASHGCCAAYAAEAVSRASTSSAVRSSSAAAAFDSSWATDEAPGIATTHDIRIVRKDLDDGCLNGTAQAETFGDEAAGKNQHSSRGHFAQR